MEIVTFGIAEEPELVESLCRAAQVGQGVSPAFGDSLRIDHVSGAGKHAVLDPVDVDLRIVATCRGVRVEALATALGRADAFTEAVARSAACRSAAVVIRCSRKRGEAGGRGALLRGTAGPLRLTRPQRSVTTYDPWFKRECLVPLLIEGVSRPELLLSLSPTIVQQKWRSLARGTHANSLGTGLTLRLQPYRALN